MNHVKDFKEYLTEGIAKKQFPDIPRANSLIEESDDSYEILKEYIKRQCITDKYRICR